VYDRIKSGKRLTVDEKSTLRDVVNSHPYQIKKMLQKDDRRNNLPGEVRKALEGRLRHTRYKSPW